MFMLESKVSKSWIAVSATAVSDVLMHLHYDESELTNIVDEIEIL